MNFIFNYVWNRKKKEIVKDIKIKSAVLTIIMHNGTKHTWSKSPYNGTSITAPWKNFWKWFYCRTSDFYNIKYNNGLMMIKRKEIYTFNMEIIEVTQQRKQK